MPKLPKGFRAHVASIGIKDTSDDFVVVASDTPATAVGVFTKSRFAGCSVSLSRQALVDNQLSAIAVISKNANVATGPEGDSNAREVVSEVARVLDVADSSVAIASTGVIGRHYPMEKVRSHLSTMRSPFVGQDAGEVATAIMTTDTHPKTASATVGSTCIVGVAKGVGMIEPDMATLLTFFFTDAELGFGDLDPIFRRVMDGTFNAVSIDTDTSTSDTAIIMANGRGGPVDHVAFESALREVALALTKMVALDGEGAQTLIEVRVDTARDDAQAKRVAKSIVNSPLVKTSVHGADPNWGRVAMAIGKCSEDLDIDQDVVVIRYGDVEAYPRLLSDEDLARLSHYLESEEVLIHVSLGIGDGCFTAYGCDLTDGYIRINADYTT